MIRSLLLAIALFAPACASSGDLRCKPSDNTVAFCQIGSHEECETQPNGCVRCTCQPDRPEEIEHGPHGPQFNR